MCPEDSPRFIVDINVGKLARWLRMIGYDTQLFDHRDDNRLIHIAMTENRVILTRDTQMMKRRVITTSVLKAVFISSDNPHKQIHQVIKELGLKSNFNPFSLCLECNQPLVKINREDVKDRVPPYVYQTQPHYVECPKCHRIYWQGTHWQAMARKLESLINS
jgi:uncharacterized protein with PIN domain